MEEKVLTLKKTTKNASKHLKETTVKLNNTDKKIELGISQKLIQNHYIGFTIISNARHKVINSGKQGIIYSLLYNMIKLIYHKHKRINYNLRKINYLIRDVTEIIKKQNIILKYYEKLISPENYKIPPRIRTIISN